MAALEQSLPIPSENWVIPLAHRRTVFTRRRPIADLVERPGITARRTRRVSDVTAPIKPKYYKCLGYQG
jgi:hypothetical protein